MLHINLSIPFYLHGTCPTQAYVSVNKNFETSFVRIGYSSLTTPSRWLDMDLNDPESKVEKLYSIKVLIGVSPLVVPHPTVSSGCLFD